MPMSSETSSKSVREVWQQTHTEPVCTVCTMCATGITFLWFCVTQAAVGNLQVQDVYLSSNTKKLLVRLADSCDRLQVAHTHTQHTRTIQLLFCLLYYFPIKQKNYNHWLHASASSSNLLLVSSHVCLWLWWSPARVRLSSRSVLTSLKVDPAALLNTEKSGRVKGLILTMKGNKSPSVWWTLG